MSQPHNLTGSALKRFVHVATLLSMIDQVREEPTVHGLDKHPHDSKQRQDNLQKKFLDSFAYICSTAAKGGETAAAVCLERHMYGFILRVARNRGVPKDAFHHLRSILNNLATVADRTYPAREIEPDILLQIVNLTKDKIRGLLEKLRRGNVRVAIDKAMDTMENEDLFPDEPADSPFRVWIQNLPVLASLEPDAPLDEVIPHIKWASKAKWRYSEQMGVLLCPDEDNLPTWINDIYKLGRYDVAARNMVQLAVKQPWLFEQIDIQTIEAPDRIPFQTLREEEPLTTVIKRLTNVDHSKLIDQLGVIWRRDPGDWFTARCPKQLTVHAEMQLLNFYDSHPEHTPTLRFMGTSKKTCFLCHEFMSRHSLAMSASASHYKIYPSWAPAPCSSEVRKKNKVMLWELSRHLEQTAGRDLQHRLGVFRPKSLDSTAGPSPPASTSSASTGLWVADLPQRAHPNL